MENTRKKRQPKLRRITAYLILAVVLTLALGASVAAYIVAGDRLNIVNRLPYGSELQNNRVTYSRALEYTYLGTYKDTIVCVDADNNEVWRYPTRGAVSAIVYDNANNRIIAGSQGKRVYILDGATGAEIRTIDCKAVVNDIDYNEESRRLLVAEKVNAGKGYVRIYTDEGEMIASTPTIRPANGCAFAADFQSFYYCGKRLYRADMEGNELASATLSKDIYALDVSEDTGRVVATDDNGWGGCYDGELKEIFKVAMNNLDSDGRAVSITRDGTMVAAGTREGDVFVFDETGRTMFYKRLSSAIADVVIDGEYSFVVPLSTELYSLDMSAAAKLSMYSSVRQIAKTAMLALPLFAFLAWVLAFGRSRGVFYAFCKSAHRHRTAYFLLLPSFALIIIFNYIPVGQAFWFAFTDWNQNTTSMRDVKFIGLDNFSKMLSEGYFLLGVKNMLIIMAFNFLKLLVPLIVAELVFANGSNRARYWYRFLLVLPMVVPGVVSTLMWKQIYDPATGLINKVLEMAGRPDLMRSWLGREDTALWALIFMGFPWVNSFAFLVFYGGLINIPADLFEAARVDGSNPFWNLTRIHLPLLMPQIKMILILTFISSIQDYGSVLLLTDGGPGFATYVPGFELYMNATRLGQYGYACALGLVMFIAILAGTILNMKIKTDEALG